MKNKSIKKIKRYREVFKELLKKIPHLFTQKDIYNYFKKEKINIDRTTIYRNIKRLIKEKNIFEVDYFNKITFYEKRENNLKHHHHFICQKCLKNFSFFDKSIEKDLLKLVKKLKIKMGIKVIGHNFLLNGYCSSCKKD